MKKLLKDIKEIGSGLVLSYPQIFFSKSYTFSIFLLVITFIFPTLGLSGLICTLSALVFAKLISLLSEKVKNGYYGYNALLVGLGLGSFYEWDLNLFALLFFAGFLTLLTHTFLEGVLSKYRLPVLSIPFLLALWIIQLATKNMDFLTISDRSIFLMDNIFGIGGIKALQWYDYFNNELLPIPVKYFFISLGSIFFQENAIAGFFIFIGLLLYSRIASTLAVLGFTTAYIFMSFLRIDANQMINFFVGFNFILTAIAIGGFFIIPSIYSYLWVILTTPLVVLFTISFTNLLSIWQLSVYSLPFNAIVLLFLFILFFRTNTRKKLAETTIQEYMPEKNLYSYKNYMKRFGQSMHKIHIMPPFWGEWTISQGYNGKITHKDMFKHALDFVITNNDKTYKGNGGTLEDYYCYNKVVLSPGFGTVVKVVDGIEDNQIGDVNTINNWGNTIIIKHAEYLYSQLNHLKAGSFKVKEGDFVKAGQPIAQVGNSGRSPEPHLHFQLQAYPYIGSSTIEYPIARYLLKNKQDKSLQLFNIPKEGEIIESTTINNLIYKAFHFIPGQQIDVIYNLSNQQKIFKWEILTDSYNNTYIYCRTTKSFAYTYNDGLSFYFNSFHGNKKSPLYAFYLSCYHVEFSANISDTVQDEFPLHQVFSFYSLFIQDIFAPFFQFIKSGYSSKIKSQGNFLNQVEIETHIHNKFFGKILKSQNASILIDNQGIYNIRLKDKKTESNIKLIFKERYE